MIISTARYKLFLILFIFFFSFIWLSEIRPILSDSLNMLVRYTTSIGVLVIYIFITKHFRLDRLTFILANILTMVIFIVNIVAMNFTLFSSAFYIFPILIILFYKNTVNSIKFTKLFIALHIIILMYSFEIFRIIQQGGINQLNQNEVSSYSFILLVLFIIVSNRDKFYYKLILFHLSITFLIAFLTDTRAIMLSSIFIFLIILLKNWSKLIKHFILVSFIIITLFIPVILLQLNQEIRLIHGGILLSSGATEDVIEADFDRYDMYELVHNTLDNHLFGKGIGNIDYIGTIKISGLHSGTLDLLYWGGYPLYITFMSIFLLLIYIGYKKTNDFMLAMVLIYWLLLLNYYEGLLFGNMGLTILFVYLVMYFYNKGIINER